MTSTSSPLAPDWGMRHGVTHLWNEIVPGLYVGGTDDADVVGQAVLWETRAGRLVRPDFAPAFITLDEFDAVVTLYAFARPVDWGVEELRWGIMDDRENPIAFDLETMQETVRWAHKRWAAGKRVLSRCQAGLNRSSLVTALVLVRDGYEPQQAVDAVRHGRTGQCLFNTHFYRFVCDTPVEFWRA
jgi:hypothetical protein